MKRFTALLLCLVLMTGCGSNSPAGNEAGGSGVGAAGGAPAEGLSASGGLTGEITVSSFNALPHKTFLETAAALFEAKYPGTKINVDVYSAMPEVKTMETEDGKAVALMMADGDVEGQRPDYISKITTEMMSGGGPDLMAVDVLPYYQYALGGQIENLNAYMDSDPTFNQDDYRGNLLDAVKIDGGLYVLPLDYSFELVAYAPSLFSESALAALASKDRITYDEMLDIAAPGFDPNGEAKLYGLNGGNMLLDNMLDADYGSYVDVPGKKANFDDGAFAALLEKAKAYEDAGYISPLSQRGSGMNIEIDSNHETYYKTVNNMMLMNYYTNYFNEAKTGAMRNRININGSVLEDTDEILGPVTNAKGEIPFSFTQAYAMNANSSNKPLAWAFMKFLASEEVQTSGAAGMGGIPINNRAAEAKAKLEAAGQGQRMMGFTVGTAGGAAGGGAKQPGGEGPVLKTPEGGAPVDSEGTMTMQPQDSGGPRMRTGPMTGETVRAEDVVLTDEQQKVYDAYMSAINKYSDMLNVFFVKDSTVTSIINTEVKSYFNGQKSADEAAAMIQNKAGLYLSE